MNEVPWFERDLIFGKPKDMLPYFLERLAGTVVRIEAKVLGVSEEILSERWNGKWSVKENIGHLAEVDAIANKRISEMVAGISPMSPAVFEPTKDYNKMPIADVIKYFLKTRSENIARYRNLTNGELLKSSLHPRLKLMMTPVDLAWFDAEHDDHHLVKINFILDKRK
jgi:DinB superfamily